MKNFVYAAFIAVFLLVSKQASQQNVIYPGKNLRNVAIKQTYQLPVADLPMEMENNPYTKSKGESFSKYTLGTTEYDLQTNRSVDNQRIHFYKEDKTIAAVWTMGTGGFLNRGTGYNFFDGKNWGNQPKERIERDYTTGWGGYSPLNDGEVVMAHKAAEYLVMSKRQKKGTGEWETKAIKHPDSIQLGWPRMVVVGDTIHVISTSLDSLEKVKVPIIYSRSVDRGETWTHRILPGMDYAAEQIRYYPDCYAWATPKNGKLAFVVGDMTYDLFIMKSEDGGETWTKKVIFEHPKPFFFDKKEPLDTTYVPDGCVAIEFDNNGKLHVVFGVMRILVNNPESNSYLYYPFASYLAYWNEDFEIYKSLDYMEMYNLNRMIAWLQDLNGDEKLFEDFNSPSQITSYNATGLVSQPQLTIDENNHLFVIFSHLNENLNTGGPKYQYYRHVWATKSEDGGFSWSDFTEITGGPLNEYGECVFASMAKASDDYIHIIYQTDELPGLSVLDKDNHPQNTNYIVYTKVLKSDIGETSDNIKKYNTINSVLIYPNPASDIANIQIISPFSYTVNIKIQNIIGQVVFNHVYSVKAGNNIIPININNFNNGIYIVSVETENYKVSQKLIIEKH